MNNIKDILNSIKMKTNSNDYYRIFETYNEAIDECIEELSKHNLVICPTEEQLTAYLTNTKNVHVGFYSRGTRGAMVMTQEMLANELAKSLLALLHNDTKGS